MKPKTTTLWKSMCANMKSDHGSVDWQIGKWEKENLVEACSTGFHASERIIDGMGYVNMEVLAKVEVRGKSDLQHDKQCWSEMRIIDAWIWKREDSVRLAIYAAELVIDIFEKEYPKDKRPRKAIDAAKKWLKEKTTATRTARAAAASAAAWAAWATSDAAAASAAAAAARAAAATSDVAARAAWATSDVAARAAAASDAAARAAAASDLATTRTARDAAFKKITDQCERFIQDTIPTLDRYRPESTPENIESLRDDEVFVFGSNAEGNHAGGAAKVAGKLFGAVEGQGEGLQDKSYAIPTMSGLKEMKAAIKRFVAFATKTPDKYFYVTKIGTGIAGHTEDEVKALFPKKLPKNVILPPGWVR